MKVTIDDQDLKRLQAKLKRMSKSKQGVTTDKVMRAAAEPTLKKAQTLVKVGEKRPLYGKEKLRPLTYERGGRLKKDLRIKVMTLQAYSKTAMVGVSSKSDKVGWRMHFQEFGPITGKRQWKYTPFMKPAEAATRDQVEANIIKSVNEAVGKEFKEFS